MCVSADGEDPTEKKKIKVQKKRTMDNKSSCDHGKEWNQSMGAKANLMQ